MSFPLYSYQTVFNANSDYPRESALSRSIRFRSRVSLCFSVTKHVPFSITSLSPSFFLVTLRHIIQTQLLNHNR